MRRWSPEAPASRTPRAYHASAPTHSQAPRRQQGFHHPYPVATLLALERLHVRREQRFEVTRDAMKHLRDAAPQFLRLHAALPQREVRAGARPERPLVGSGNRHEEGAQGRERLEIREQREGLLHPQRGDSLDQRLPHRPYSFILRVRALRWMPSTSAARSESAPMRFPYRSAKCRTK